MDTEEVLDLATDSEEVLDTVEAIGTAILRRIAGFIRGFREVGGNGGMLLKNSLILNILITTPDTVRKEKLRQYVPLLKKYQMFLAI